MRLIRKELGVAREADFRTLRAIYWYAIERVDKFNVEVWSKEKGWWS
jgi:hypothetical protein